MIDTLRDAALMRYLQSKRPLYYAKIFEVRELIERWLSYVPQTFPHYTSHTIDHSDTIVVQLSHILFHNSEPAQPTVQLSGIEAYILICAAYLHDAGMVTSDHEKARILESPEWRAWIAGPQAAARWQQIEHLRENRAIPDAAVRHFLADVQLRFLIAEWVRRRHHVRAGEVIEQHHAGLARLDFDDPMLRRTIAAVCVAHGLDRVALDDPEQYPDRRTIQGEAANVRFLAILLRIGDLLDLRCDRACPLLLNPASPLPSDSLAHWTQYQRIVHTLFAPDTIEITAECTNQNEHRFLRDWCQWLADETHQAHAIMRRSKRHETWSPPHVSLSGERPTIELRPTSNATYVAKDWHFELDQSAIFERLVTDAYPGRNEFVRELIQNALDAMRCRMYADLETLGLERPEFPTEVDESTRRRYVLKVGIREVSAPNELSGLTETRQEIFVDDCGIGMTEDVIQNYFLQVGQSYYVTPEFRRSYQFVPTSRFGIGFLSVFAESESVVVETRPMREPARALRLRLTGPRQYILTERSPRTTSGTLVAVTLRTSIQPGVLTKLVAQWCRRVEFPIEVDDLGTRTVITAERQDDFTSETDDVIDKDAKLIVRSIPIGRRGVEGEFILFAYLTAEGESWSRYGWAKYTYPTKSPLARAPRMPTGLTCFHGIALANGMGRHLRDGAVVVRVDFRRAKDLVTLSRGAMRELPDEDVLRERLTQIVSEHVSSSPFALAANGWQYKQRLVDDFRVPDFWHHCPGTIRAYFDGLERMMSLAEVQKNDRLSVVCLGGVDMHSYMQLDTYAEAKDVTSIPGLSLTDEDVDRLSGSHRRALFQGRGLRRVYRLTKHLVVCEWDTKRVESAIPVSEGDRLMPASFDPVEWIGASLHTVGSSVHRCVALNEDHPIVRYLLAVRERAEDWDNDDRERWRTVVKLLSSAIEYHHTEPLSSYLLQWRAADSGFPAVGEAGLEIFRSPLRERR